MDHEDRIVNLEQTNDNAIINGGNETAGTMVIGTNNAQTVTFKQNNVNKLSIGSAGVGTTVPLDVTGNITSTGTFTCNGTAIVNGSTGTAGGVRLYQNPANGTNNVRVACPST